MVYCGKASQGCQSCRTRRIKCDKIKPGCTQCVRVGKKCPGYRDQLSLMFRDESSKVIQKAHAQWGISQEGASTGPSASASASTSVWSSPRVPVRRGRLSPPHAHAHAHAHSRLSTLPRPLGSSPGPFVPAHTPSPSSSTDTESEIQSGAAAGTAITTLASDPQAKETKRLHLQFTTPRTVDARLLGGITPTADDRGVQFYINHYILRHPGGPESATDLDNLPWIFSPTLRDALAAVGLAAQSNLNGDSDMTELSKKKYFDAIQQTGKLITKPHKTREDSENVLRTVVTLALFEVVKVVNQSIGSVSAHLQGAAALMHSMAPQSKSPVIGHRQLIQLGYSLFIPCQASGTRLPQAVFDIMHQAGPNIAESTRPEIPLGVMNMRFLDISAAVYSSVLADGRPRTEQLLQQLLSLDEDFGSWEAALPPEWHFAREHDPSLPAAGVFRGKYHTYPDLWMARMWGHYRWARILVQKLILEFVDRFPDTSLMLVSAIRRSGCFEVSLRLAEDVLASTPSHWCHPHLAEANGRVMLSPTSPGAGVLGTPAMLHTLRVAGCAPGATKEMFEWAYGIVRCVWAEMGMLHARIILDMMDKHHAATSGSDFLPPIRAAIRAGSTIV